VSWLFLELRAISRGGFNFREETILSAIKTRQAGFADCIDTHESSKRQLTRLRDLRINLLMPSHALPEEQRQTPILSLLRSFCNSDQF
jgi:hypothetical protein